MMTILRPVCDRQPNEPLIDIESRAPAYRTLLRRVMEEAARVRVSRSLGRHCVISTFVDS